MLAVYDVFIIGLGPVGAVLANALGQAGLRVGVCERAAEIYDKPRAINIDHEAMRLLQSVGLADAVERITTHHTGTLFLGCEDQLIKAFTPMPPPYPLGWPPNLTFIQPEFEAILRDGLRRFPNVDVMLECECVDVEQSSERVRARIRRNDGNVETIDATFVVACDGAASPTRRRLGVGQDSLDFDEAWTVVDAWLKDPDAAPKSTTQYCRPDAPTTYVVGPRNLRRWELKLLPHEDPSSYEDVDVVKRRLAPFVDPDAIDIWRAATYRFHALIAEAWQVGRVLLAGDAAHQMPPFMAQGLCSGFRDIGNLAWKLVAVVRGDQPASLLSTYGEERKPHLRALVETTKDLGLIIGELDSRAAAARDARMMDALARSGGRQIRQDLIASLGAGLIGGADRSTAKMCAGTLFPQPWVKAGERNDMRLDDLLGSSFALVVDGQETKRWLDRESLRTWSRIGGPMLVLHSADAGGGGDPDVVYEQGTLLRDWMAENRAHAVIVRPDKYVFDAAGDAKALRGMIAHLDRVLTDLALI